MLKSLEGKMNNVRFLLSNQENTVVTVLFTLFKKTILINLFIEERATFT